MFLLLGQISMDKISVDAYLSMEEVFLLELVLLVVLVITKGMRGWRLVRESCYLSQGVLVCITGKSCKQKTHVHSSEERR